MPEDGIIGRFGILKGRGMGVPKTDAERAVTHGSNELPPRGTGLGAGLGIIPNIQKRLQEIRGR